MLGDICIIAHRRDDAGMAHRLLHMGWALPIGEPRRHAPVAEIVKMEPFGYLRGFHDAIY
jgi:hypothetical protein